MTVATSSLVFLMLVLIAAFAVVAKWLRQPYPIVFVIGGGLLALIPGLPPISLAPDLVFLVFLPPLLYGGGFGVEWREFKRHVAPIMSLAVGLVAFTTVVVAWVAHAFLGLPLAAAFVLGAVLSPPDAIATEAIAKELPLPRTLKAILSGESLVNDASALVIYRFAVATVATGVFSWWQAGLQFVYVSVAGVAIGIGGIWLMAHILIWLRRKQLADETVSVLFSLVTPFVVYVGAESVHASGVLAAVTAGILTSQKISQIFDYDARIAAYGVWSVMTFSLNGVLFVLIGLQLRSILAGLSQYSPLTLLGYGVAISATIIAIRFVWIYPIALVRFALSRRNRSSADTMPSWRTILIVSWAGMRGIVTLATALALPVATLGGAPFPDRNLILFLAFFVIVVTLVGQGATLPLLIRSLPVVRDDDPASSLAYARAQTAEAGLDALRSLEATFVTPAHWEIAGRIRDIYEQLVRYETIVDGENGDEAATFARELRRATFSAERQALVAMRRRGDIRDEVYRQLEWDLDLAESRFADAFSR